jgi:hypothetical protein
MDNPKRTTDAPPAFVYHGKVPPLLALLLVAPLLLVFLSLAAALVIGGALAAFFLPLFFRGRLGKPRDADCIELERDQYSRVDTHPRQLPPA